MYADGILVNGPVVMSTTLTFATLGFRSLVCCYFLVHFAASGAGYLCQAERAAGLAAAFRIVGIASPGLWRVPDCFTDPRFPFCFCDLNAVLPRKHSARQSRKPPGL